MKTTPCLMLLLPVAAWAEHSPTPPARPEPLPDPAPEIRAEPPATATPPAPPQAHTIKLSADELARQPRLLHRALTAAVLRQHPDNIKLLLPLYLRLPEAQRGDKVLIELAQAALAEQAQHPGTAPPPTTAMHSHTNPICLWCA
uniref:Surface lipoprotein assembly modifier N-terminal TPR repeats region domain-containing protein n=1 Tax=Conchiformibius kuhniae TaxID=211502 RepID=A0A8T9MZS6_9NEIS|nr:hypothetical protein LVJ77_03475 [Conchiformibius kuhniae]